MRNLVYTLLILSTIIFTACNDKAPEELLPEACFEVSPSSGKVDDEFQFTNCSDNATKFLWEFGDGETSTLQEPTHVFEQQGAYEVKLFAGEDANDDGEFDELDEPDIFTLMLDVAPNNTSIDVIIKDATTWSQESPSLDVVENAEVNLYADQAALDADQAAYTKVSNELGQVIFYDLEEGDYLMTVEKGTLSNVVNGYLVNGVFQSQAEIDSYSEQDGAEVGGIKYSDTNGDGMINQDDITTAKYVSVSDEETLEGTVYIAE